MWTISSEPQLTKGVDVCIRSTQVPMDFGGLEVIRAALQSIIPFIIYYIFISNVIFTSASCPLILLSRTNTHTQTNRGDERLPTHTHFPSSQLSSILLVYLEMVESAGLGITMPGLQLNLSPFFDLNGSPVSYLLFSLSLWPSVCGAWLVAAGSNVDSWLGEPEWSDLTGPPFV